MTVPRSRTDRDDPYLGALFGGVLLMSAALAAVWLYVGLPRPVCLFREWTGIPCVTCGTTRMAESLLTGDVLDALAQNPLVFLVLAAVALWAVLSTARWIFGLPVWRPALGRRRRLALRIGAVVALLAGWAYVILRSAAAAE